VVECERYDHLGDPSPDASILHIVPRPLLALEELSGLSRAAFGTTLQLVAVDRLRGGSRKGVYRLHFDNATTAILYRWAEAENYWPDDNTQADPAGPFTPSSGLGYFAAAHSRLTTLGVRVPKIHRLDDTHEFHQADLALVEDVPGGTLETALQRDPRTAASALVRLGQHLAVMHRYQEGPVGNLGWLASGGRPPAEPCEQIVFERALIDLTSAAARIDRLAAVFRPVEDLLRSWARDVVPRRLHALIHSELGPDHVLLDPCGEPVLIDIEGLMTFDVEWEHVFLQLRFGPHYTPLATSNLDPARMRLYRLAMHLSLVAGPLRLLDGDFPDRTFMEFIIESNLQAVLDTLAHAS
jgi:hypothetical protein